MGTTTSTTKRVLIPKRYLTYSAIIFCGIFYLYILRCNIITTFLKHQSSSHSSEITLDQCQLSFHESDGWFCEFDLDWLRRKRLHHIQDRRNHISDSRSLFFQNNWEPTIQCEFERRIGNTGDGGKWICDIHRFPKENATSLIYSFGSDGHFGFERAIKEELPNADIYTFDMTNFTCPINICIFHQARLGDGMSDGSKTLQMIMNELGHQKRNIDILKIDIEGSEFQLFSKLFKSTDQTKGNKIPYMRQILLEIHLEEGNSDEPCKRTHALFENFRANNYAIFHKETNLYNAQNVYEYAFLRLNPAFFIPPHS